MAFLLENWDAVGLSEWEEDRRELLDKIKVKTILSHMESARGDHLSDSQKRRKESLTDMVEGRRLAGEYGQ